MFYLRSNDRPVFSFEIDNDPRRAETNRIKIGVDPVELIPIINLGVHHGRVANWSRPYTDRMLVDAALPPRFFENLPVNTESYESTLRTIVDWIEDVFMCLRWAPEWGTVLEVASQYQDLVTSGGFRLATVHLETQAELAWALSRAGLLEVERAACLTIALARMLQRGGHHRAARRQMSRLSRRIPSANLLSSCTASSANAVAFLLGQMRGSNAFSSANLSNALSSVSEVYHRSQFLWRSAIPHILGDRIDLVENVVFEYGDLSESTVTESNIALLRALYAIKWRRGDRIRLAADYARNEHKLLASKGAAPDGTIHGLVGALYLKVAAEVSSGNNSAASLLSEIDIFCVRAGVPQTADGLREIGYVLPGAIGRLQREQKRTNPFLLWRQTNRHLKEDLQDLYARLE